MHKDKEIRDGQLVALFSYLGVLCIIPLVLKKENKFAVFHGKQGLIIFVLEVISLILAAFPTIGLFLSSTISIFCLLLSLWGIIQVLLGKYGRIYLINTLAEKVTV